MKSPPYRNRAIAEYSTFKPRAPLNPPSYQIPEQINAAMQLGCDPDGSYGSSTVDLCRSILRQLYPPIAVAIAAMARMPLVCQLLP